MRSEVDMIELSEQQCQAFAAEENPTVIDPTTNASYVLVRKDVFDRIKNLLVNDEDLSHDELRLQLARSSAANGWDDPLMDAYDHYDEIRPAK